MRGKLLVVGRQAANARTMQRSSAGRPTSPVGNLGDFYIPCPNVKAVKPPLRRIPQ